MSYYTQCKCRPRLKMKFTLNRSEIVLKNVQIKSLRIARKIAKAIGEIEEVGCIHSTLITINGCFVCPDFDIEELNRNQNECDLRDILKQLTVNR